MAKTKQSKLSPGTSVRVKEGATMPEAPDLSIGGWTGSVVESQGRGDALKYIVHWDNATAARVPAAYQAKCESQGLCTDMVCLSAADIEPALET